MYEKKGPESGVRSRKAFAAGAPVLTPDSLLLTSALQEMKVRPEMLMKTNEPEHGTREYGTRGVQIPASALQETLAPCGAGRACACDGIFWEHAENKGTPEPNHPSQIANRQCHGSLLLTPAPQEMKVHPEMLMKTNGRKHGARLYGTRGAQILASGLQETLAPCGAARAYACDGIFWEHAENKGASEPNRPSQIAIRQCPGSLLLTCVLEEMQVQPD